MAGSRSVLVVAAAALTCAAMLRAGEPAPAVEWLLEGPAAVLQVRLVHADGRRLDGGVLSIDPNRRVVLWEGIPGEYGCRQALEAPFGSVRAVRDEPDGSIRLEIEGQPRDRWRFAPLPHAAWFARRSSALATGLSQDVRDQLTGPDGLSLPVGGSAAFAGPQLRRDVVPAEVTADVRLGVDRMRQALGRRPVPSVQLYEALHGRPVEVAVAELLASPASFEGRAVRVRGVAQPLPDGGGLDLSDEAGVLRVVPQPELEELVRSQARDWRGKEIEVSGLLRRSAATSKDAPSHEVGFWEFLAPETVQAKADETRTVTIQDLVERPEEFAGETVRIVGRFRGDNLEHDLPEPGPRSAWVIKSGRHSIWVTGHKPSGRGFSLRPDLAQDTSKWLEVVGRVELRDGLTTFRARAVALAAPASNVWRGTRLKTAKQPDVVFTLPLADGEPVARETLFLVQFSTYMDEESFEGRVELRYFDPSDGPGELRRVRWSYDDVRRTLIVDPGEPLRPGASVELLLLPGITDTQATPLEPASRADSGSVLRLLRWRVQG